MSNEIIYFLLDKYIDSKTLLGWSLKLGSGNGVPVFWHCCERASEPKAWEKVASAPYYPVSVEKVIFNEQVQSQENSIDLTELN